MFQPNHLSKTTAYIGLAANLVGFGLYAPYIGIYFSFISAIGLELWYILLSGDFFKTAIKALYNRNSRYIDKGQQ